MKKIAVLVVDDEENVLHLLERVLKKEGYVVFTAMDGAEAMGLLESQDIDLVITDIRLPKMTGLEILEAVQKMDTSIKVMLMTAYATLETAIEALKNGACDYITKPFNLEDILEAVKKAVATLRLPQAPQIPKNGGQKASNYLVAESPAMLKTLELIEQVADAKTTIMLYGETGTGKELTANLLHSLSQRRDKPLIKINCAAIPELLLESELFGYEKGAFTGALTRKPGRFELADGGTLFLDEIGDVPAALQAKLLRVLQEFEFERLGGTKTLKVDVRIVAATNRDLEERVRKGLFREDLYYRLNVVPINLPPLRSRIEDIPRLVEYFLQRSAQISGKVHREISKEALSVLTAYSWPGNIRELENIIERVALVSRNQVLQLEDLPEALVRKTLTTGVKSLSEQNSLKESTSLEEYVDEAEREVILKALSDAGGNRTKASELLGINRRSLHRKINKYQIE